MRGGWLRNTVGLQGADKRKIVYYCDGIMGNYYTAPNDDGKSRGEAAERPLPTSEGSGTKVVPGLGGCGRKVDTSIPRSRGPCIVTKKNYDNPECVVMPCDHVIHPDKLIEFCRGEVHNKHKWEIGCFSPLCKGKFSIEFLVKCGATEEELNPLTKEMSENYCKYNLGADIKTCPGCQCNCERNDKTKNVVTCQLCTSKNGTPYKFCWLCSLPWTQDHQCGAVGVLGKCEDITSGVKCPSVRSCPHCEVLIEKEACKHMTCSVCKAKFCVMCLHIETTSDQRETSTSPWLPEYSMV